MDFLNNQLPIDPTANNPLNRFLMPTAAQQAAQQPPQQQQQQTNPDTQALIDALRNGGMGGGAPTQGGRVQSAGYLGQGMNTGAIGNALGSAFGSSGSTPTPYVDTMNYTNQLGGGR
jgi:hypothetical protein